ncbi:hypothetical protein L3Q82_020331, partial [Scortum barcoo]
FHYFQIPGIMSSLCLCLMIKSQSDSCGFNFSTAYKCRCTRKGPKIRYMDVQKLEIKPKHPYCQEKMIFVTIDGECGSVQRAGVLSSSQTSEHKESGQVVPHLEGQAQVEKSYISFSFPFWVSLTSVSSLMCLSTLMTNVVNGVSKMKIENI